MGDLFCFFSSVCLLPSLYLGVSCDEVPTTARTFGSIAFPVVNVLAMGSRFYLAGLSVPGPSLPVAGPDTPMEFYS